MIFTNSTYDFFIAWGTVHGYLSDVQVEHYVAENAIDCMRKCLKAHGILVVGECLSAEDLKKLAKREGHLISFPRKVKMTII